jgi:phospholipase C
VRYDFPADSLFPPGITHPFSFHSTGLRVPTIVVSPLVSRGSVCHEPMDHTSILQLLAQKYGDPLASYSDVVRGRRDDNGPAHIVSVARVLNLDDPRPGPAAPAPDFTITSSAQLGVPTGTWSTMQEAFAQGAKEMAAEEPGITGENFPGVLSWARQP